MGARDGGKQDANEVYQGAGGVALRKNEIRGAVKSPQPDFAFFG